jgi:O-antigen/teichoic acid export membrane protein
VIAAALNFALPVVLTRGLLQQDAGVFFQVTALFTIVVNVGTVGADTGLLRALPQALSLRRPSDVRPQLTIALAPAFAFSLVLCGILAVLAEPISAAATGGSEAAARSFQVALYVLLPGVPLAVAYLLCLSASRGLGSVGPLVVIEKIGRGALQTGAVAVAVAVTTSLTLVVLAWVLPYLAAMLVLAWWLAERLRLMWRTATSQAQARPQTPIRSLARDFWAFSAPRALSRAFAVALQRFDIILVGALLGPAEAAVYTVATRFLVLGLMFVQAIQQVMAPRISAFLASEDDARAQRLYQTTTAWLTLVSWPLYLLSACQAPVLLSIFGADYVRGDDAVVILCLTMLVATACGPVDSMLLMGGRSVLSLMNTALALAVNVALDLVLVPRIGLTGAAWGWTAGIMLTNLLPLWQVGRSMHMHPFSRATWTAMVLTAGCYGVVPLIVRFAYGATVPALVASAALGTAIFVASVAHQRQALEISGLTGVLRRKASLPDPRPASQGNSP